MDDRGGGLLTGDLCPDYRPGLCFYLHAYLVCLHYTGNARPMQAIQKAPYRGGRLRVGDFGRRQIWRRKGAARNGRSPARAGIAAQRPRSNQRRRASRRGVALVVGPQERGAVERGPGRQGQQGFGAMPRGAGPQFQGPAGQPAVFAAEQQAALGGAQKVGAVLLLAARGPRPAGRSRCR